MHEFSIVSSLIELVEGHAGDNNAVRVLTVTIEVGDLSGVEPELFARAFQTFTSCGGILDGARLVMDTAEGRDIVLASLEMEID